MFTAVDMQLALNLKISGIFVQVVGTDIELSGTEATWRSVPLLQ